MRGMSDAPNKPTRPPIDYFEGPWPTGTVRVSDADGGERVAYQVQQMAYFVAELIGRREQRGLTVRGLARMTGLGPGTISLIETGQRWPDAKTLFLLAWALEADLRFVGRSTVRDEHAEPRA
jgi:DNA-binding XRE family transcriptional regulator